MSLDFRFKILKLRFFFTTHLTVAKLTLHLFFLVGEAFNMVMNYINVTADGV